MYLILSPSAIFKNHFNYSFPFLNYDKQIKDAQYFFWDINIKNL